MSKRVSPLSMGLQPEEVLNRDGWEIALTYAGEMSRSELFITDLSHVPKWSLQGPDLDKMKPAGLSVPEKPGSVTDERGIIICRLTKSEVRIIAVGDEIPVFDEAGYTDLTDAYAVIALVGNKCFDTLGKMSAVDLQGKGQGAPLAVQAPLEDITCLMVRLEGQDKLPGLLVAIARGYGHFLLDALLDAGKEYGIELAGWKRFRDWY